MRKLDFRWRTKEVLGLKNLSTADEQYLKVMTLRNGFKQPDTGPERCIWIFS